MPIILLTRRRKKVQPAPQPDVFIDVALSPLTEREARRAKRNERLAALGRMPNPDPTPYQTMDPTARRAQRNARLRALTCIERIFSRKPAFSSSV